MFHKPRMGFGADQLRAKALLALEEAIQEVRYGRVRRSIALRFALAYLWTQSRGEREPFDELWSALASGDQLHGFGYADQALAGIYRAVGVVRDDDLTMRMWNRAQDRYAPRDHNGMLVPSSDRQRIPSNLVTASDNSEHTDREAGH